MPGTSIAEACKAAVKIADREKQDVEFMFNDTKVVAQPGNSPESLVAKWHRDYEAACEAWEKSPERAERERKREEDLRRRMATVLVEAATTENEMRETKEPWPLTEKQLLEYIVSLVDRSHDYGTCCYAMSLAAVAAFNYVAGKLGVTGFQSSCADLDFLRRTRSMKGPFILLKGEDMLYPQYDLSEKLAEAIEGWKPWLKEQAEKNLKDTALAHPVVVLHWRKLAGYQSRVTDH